MVHFRPYKILLLFNKKMLLLDLCDGIFGRLFRPCSEVDFAAVGDQN